MKNLNDLLVHRWLKEILAAQPPSTLNFVVEVGVGNGQHAALVRRHSRHYFSLDRERRLRALDVIGDAERLPFASGRVSLVVITEVLEHLQNPVEALREISRVLQPGGIVIMSTPFLHGIHEEPSDYWRFTEYGLELMLQKSGLEFEELRRRGWLLSACSAMVWYALLSSSSWIRQNSPLGWLWAPVHWAIEQLSQVWWRAEAEFVSRIPGTKVYHAGERSRGFVGRLLQWPLGYVTLARRPYA